MSNLQLGPFLLNGPLIASLVFGLGGWIALKLWLRKRMDPVKSGLWTSLLSNAFWIWLLIWKLSYAAVHPQETLSYPMSLIYYDGGYTGIWIASIVAVSYLWYGSRKKKVELSSLAGGLAIYVTGGWFFSRLFVLILDDNSSMAGVVGAVLAGLLLLYFFVQKREASKNMLVLVIVTGLAAYSFYNYVNERSALNRLNQHTSSQDIPIGIKKGQRAPDFNLAGLSDGEVMLSDFRNNVVILNFWASWCPPCRAEMPHMQRLHEEYEDKGVVVLGVNLTSTEAGVETVRSYVQNEGLSFPVVLDVHGKASDLYRIVSYPTTYIIDREGVIRKVLPGTMNFDMLEKEIRGL